MGGYFSGKQEEGTEEQRTNDFKYVSRFEETGRGFHDSKDSELTFKTSRDMTGIEKLENYGLMPVGTIMQIFEYLKLNELLNCSCSCKLFNSIIQTDIFWKIYFENASNEKHDLSQNEGIDWKHEVFKLYFSFHAKNEYYRKLFYSPVRQNWVENRDRKKYHIIKDGRRTNYSYPASSYNFDVLFKFLLIGDIGVGKTCLLLRKTEDVFNQHYVTTIGIDFKIEKAMYRDTQIKLQIWDTSGQERFRTITSSYYKGATGILICFSIDRKQTFENAKSWYREAKRYGMKDVCIVIVGCKCDLENKREVFREDIVKLFNELNKEFYPESSGDPKEGNNKNYLSYSKDYCECSAKEKLFVELPFGMLMDKSLSLYSRIIGNE